jgi:hypothetical protein
MKLLPALALLLSASPAFAADPLFSLYAAGRYDEAVRAGEAAHTGPALAIAARALLADAALQGEPCLPCLERAEADARAAIRAEPAQADAQVWLAASLGYESRLTGILKARWRDAPGQAKTALQQALKIEPDNVYALAALGGWNIEVVRAAGGYLANMIYGAGERDGLALFDRAVKLAPGNVAVRYQVALALAGYNPDRFAPRIAAELEAAVHDAPQTAYEKAIQARAGELLSLLHANNRLGFDTRVRKYQGYR